MNKTEPLATAPLATRIRATFTAPASLPRLLRPGLPWLDVLLIATAITVVSVLTVPDDYFVRSMSDPVTRRGEPVELSSPPETIATWGRMMAMLATIATHPVVAVVLAGALMVVFTTFLRGPATFRDYLALACHGMLIPALGTLLLIAVRLLTGAVGFSELLPIGEPTSFAGALVLSIDPFVVWMLVALAWAVHATGSRMTATRASLLLVGAYLVLVAASTALLHRDLLA